MLVLEDICMALQMRLERCLEASDVVVVDAVEPILGTTDGRLCGKANHSSPPSGDVEVPGSQIPLPQAVVGTFRSERQSLSGSLELALRVRSLGDVMPKQRHAAGNGQKLYLQNATIRIERQPEVVQGPSRPIRQRIVERSRQSRSAQHRH